MKLFERRYAYEKTDALDDVGWLDASSGRLQLVK
jgi:hypothetical protein